MTQGGFRLLWSACKLLFYWLQNEIAPLPNDEIAPPYVTGFTAHAHKNMVIRSVQDSEDDGGGG